MNISNALFMNIYFACLFLWKEGTHNWNILHWKEYLINDYWLIKYKRLFFLSHNEISGIKNGTNFLIVIQIRFFYLWRLIYLIFFLNDKKRMRLRQIISRSEKMGLNGIILVFFKPLDSCFNNSRASVDFINRLCDL